MAADGMAGTGTIREPVIHHLAITAEDWHWGDSRLKPGRRHVDIPRSQCQSEESTFFRQPNPLLAPMTILPPESLFAFQDQTNHFTPLACLARFDEPHDVKTIVELTILV